MYLRVNVHVLLQTDSVAEGLPADAAAKRSRATVRPPDVDLQPVGRRENLKQSWSVNEGGLNREMNCHGCSVCNAHAPCRR